MAPLRKAKILRRSQRLAAKTGTIEPVILKRKAESIEEDVETKPPTKRLKLDKSPAEQVPVEEITTEPTHRIIDGPFEGYQVRTRDNDNEESVFVTVETLINSHVIAPPYRQVKIVQRSQLESLDHAHMLRFAENVADDDEDLDVLKQESKPWVCPKCEANVLEEDASCKAQVDGATCGGKRKMPDGGPIGWGGCFMQIPKTWTCQECSQPNPVGANVCSVCQTPHA
ncbi:expressed unknown protein [Seminavis robusta]|uniref:RanBP2-type domain-containing protein n=1 Tax=Seminavis robusta TaxID=568900 RepID=A0A9N8EQC7_9STRA|nr:expressed unknown protein [Seminavis robusta]|eukprot:Sro1660_g289270.1 n/a (227) ;mRNA; r:3306-3986